MKKNLLFLCLLLCFVAPKAHAEIDFNELKDVGASLASMQQDLVQMQSNMNPHANYATSDKMSDLQKVSVLVKESLDWMYALDFMLTLAADSKNPKAATKTVNEWIRRYKERVGINIKYLNGISVIGGISPIALTQMNKMKEYLHRLDKALAA